MDKQIDKLLRNEIVYELQTLSNFDIESEEITSVIDNIAKLVEMEQKYSMNQEIDRYLKFGLDVAGVILPLMFYGLWMGKGFKFEETGAFTSTTFRSLFGNFKPKK